MRWLRLVILSKSGGLSMLSLASSAGIILMFRLSEKHTSDYSLANISYLKLATDYLIGGMFAF